LWFRMPRTRSLRFLSNSLSRPPFTFIRAIATWSCWYGREHTSKETKNVLKLNKKVNPVRLPLQQTTQRLGRCFLSPGTNCNVSKFTAVTPWRKWLSKMQHNFRRRLANCYNLSSFTIAHSQSLCILDKNFRQKVDQLLLCHCRKTWLNMPLSTAYFITIQLRQSYTVNFRLTLEKHLLFNTSCHIYHLTVINHHFTLKSYICMNGRPSRYKSSKS
jgi:hypothetical protein